MKDGEIKLDSEAGKEIGFTSDKFEGWLWKVGDAIVISFIVSKKRGNFRALVETIRGKGYRVEIPTPLGRMFNIVTKNRYKLRVQHTDDMGPVDVWSLEPKP